MAMKTSAQDGFRCLDVKPVDEHRFRILTTSGLAAVEENPILEMVADRPGEHAPLDVAAFADQVIGRVAVADAFDVLLDDGTFVQISRDVMARGANQFHATIIRLVVRPGPNKTRQKAVVDVDDPPDEPVADVGAQDLHVPGQHHEVDLTAQQLADIVATIPVGRVGTADDIAKTVRFLALECPYVTGQIWSVDGGRSVAGALAVG